MVRAFLFRVINLEGDALPPLGKFAVDALGEERARHWQRILYSRWFVYLDITVIFASSIILTTEIDRFVRNLRVKGGAPSSSADYSSDEYWTPTWLSALSDFAFISLSGFSIAIRNMCEGYAFYSRCGTTCPHPLLAHVPIPSLLMFPPPPC